MTKVKKIKFNSPAMFFLIFLDVFYIITMYNNLQRDVAPLLVNLLPYLVISISALVIYYKGALISEKFLEACKKKTIPNPNGVFQITLSVGFALFGESDDEMSQYRRIRNDYHILTTSCSLLCGVILLIMLKLGYSGETIYTTSLLTFIGFLIFHIVLYLNNPRILRSLLRLR